MLLLYFTLAFAKSLPASAGIHSAFAGISLHSAGIHSAFADIPSHSAGIHSNFAGTPPHSAGITIYQMDSPTTREFHLIPYISINYLIAFIIAYLYNILLGAKPTWHGRNIRVTPKNAITARICWAFFVL